MRISGIIALCMMLSQANAVYAHKEESAENYMREFIMHLNATGERYIKANVTTQVWLRYTQVNPGSTIDYHTMPDTWDVGLRRVRAQAYGKLTDRVFFYIQTGVNNLAYNTPRKQGVFLHDVLSEYEIKKEKLSIGAGLSGWGGPSRFSSPAAASILTLDAPLYQQITSDVTDQFLRKLSVYAKGKLGKWDYRVALAKPMAVSQNTVQSTEIAPNARFASGPSHMQYHGYLMYQFKEKEANLLPYTIGTYLGKKRVFNIGAGFVFQKNAMWYKPDSYSDTLYNHLSLFAVDMFYDHPIHPGKGTALSVYSALHINDYGKNYIRNIGVMNPSTGINDKGSFNGAGNAFPMIGTGVTFYTQAGWLFRKRLLKELGTLQPYLAMQYSDFQALNQPMWLYTTGINWLIHEHKAKISLDYQNRPVYQYNPSGNLTAEGRKSMVVMQLQIAI